MASIKDLEPVIGVKIHDGDIYQTAFTHRSYLNEFSRHDQTDIEHNERLEFLGDAVLELIVTEYLYRTYSEPEGILTNWRSALVKTESLSAVAEELGLEPYIRLSRGERNGSRRARWQILANTMEALIGAIYLDRGYEAAQEFVTRTIIATLPAILDEGSWQDAKTKYQEMIQEQESETPTYHVLEESGPDHDKRFEVGVYVGDELRGQGTGSSKQSAQQEAASDALARLEDNTGANN